MNISSHQIQNVIRAYGQRIERKGLARLRASVPQSISDSISISSEAKNRQITEKIASEIVSRATGHSVYPQEAAVISDKLFEQIGDRLGGKIDFLSGDRRGGFKFKVIDPEKGEIVKELSAEDLQNVISNIYNKIETNVNEV